MRELYFKYLTYFPYKLGLIYTVICIFSGQFYPFSEFPMYSSFPKCATVYYLVDSTDNPVFLFPELGRNAPDFKQQIEHRAERNYPNEWSQETITKAAKEVGCEMIPKNPNSAFWNSRNSVFLIQTTYCGEEEEVSEIDTVLVKISPG